VEPGPIRMVCFDAGGVLVRICRTWREGCEAAGAAFCWNDAVEAREPERDALSEAYQRGEIASGEFFTRIAHTADGLYTADEIQLVHGAWILGEYPGARELIDRLNQTDRVTTGLLSNTNALHWEQEHMWGGRGVSAVGRVRHPCASHLLGLLKPGVEIYRAFERETGFAAGEILFFDDLPENVEGARASGWRAELIDHAGDTPALIAAHLAAHGVCATPA
jgi:FMN phosphatase YigB (HAD superfamily)